MIPFELLDETDVPGSGQPLRLYRRGEEFSIRIGTAELMNSRRHGSEEALAELACAPGSGRPGFRVLVGGLGMGFTLAAALRSLPPDGRAVVAELIPAVVGWNRGPLGEAAGHPLGDPRVTVVEADVAHAMGGEHAPFDAILLDVDNGPEALSHPGNRRLYSADGLDRARRALRPGGVLAIWSAGPDAAFPRRLRGAGFSVEEHRVRVRPGRGRARHLVWTARRP